MEEIRQLPSWPILGAKHILFILAFVITLWIALFLLKKIEKDKHRKIELYLGIVFLSRKALVLPYAILYGEWAWYEYLPFHLCDLTIILSAIFLINRSQFLFEITLFLGLPGAINAIATPVLIHGDILIFEIDYFIEHLSILITGVYAISILKLQPRKGYWWKTFLFGLCFLYIPVAIFNSIMKTNFMYTHAPPYKDHFLVFGPWPFYTLGFLTLSIVVCWSINQCYYPFWKKPHSIMQK